MNQLRNLFRVQSATLLEQRLVDSIPFPLVLRPDPPLSNGNTTDNFLNWVNNNHTPIQSNLAHHGAILFRDFALPDANAFNESIKAFGMPLFNYVGGTAYRKVITGNVATASEVAAHETIPFHHEKAYTSDYPKVCYFFCNTAPKEGGQTPLAHSYELYKEMTKREPKFVEKLEKDGVRYIRILPENDDPEAAIGLGWKSSYQTEDKKEAEKRANLQGTSFKWLPNGNVKTTTDVLPAIYSDTRTGRKTWLNAITTAYFGWQDSRNDRKKAVTFGNGDLMPDGPINTLVGILDEIAVDIPWQAGDLMMVDNRQALHGRRPYTPPRKILACLCDDPKP